MSTATLEGTVLDLNEVEETKEVKARKLGRAYYTIDENGRPYETGRIHVTNYDDGKAKHASFIDVDGKDYSLGKVGRTYRPLDLIATTQAIMSHGFVPKIVQHSRGGSNTFALFSHPDHSMRDHINWDTEIYGESDKSLGLQLSIALWWDVAVGRMIRVACGYFRTICSNGLVADIIGLGSLKAKHHQYQVGKVEELSAQTISQSSNYQFQTFSPKVLEYPLQLIDAYQDDPGKLVSLPSFVRNPFNTIVGNLANYSLDELGYQVNLALDKGDDLTVLDNLNILTNVSNESDSQAITFNLPTFASAFHDLMAISAFKADLEFPHVTR